MADNPPVEIVPGASKDRIDKLQKDFQSKFNQQPVFYARASGRVNLIGEHIDYCGYAVLPMAIEQDVVFAAAPNDTGKILMSNTNPKYADFEADIENFTINSSDPKWFNYALCGVKGMQERFGSKGKGFTCLVDGCVPQSAGLSSSSALVCCAALAMMHASGWSLSKKEISDLCADCERYIGTQGGGMDQAICFMAQKGTAKLIEFNPLRSVDVALPDGAVFVISNSCVELNKAATSDFNIRVVECRLSTQLMAKSRGLEWRDLKKLGDLQQKLGLSVEDMLAVVKEVLHEAPYTKDEVCQILGVTPDELADTTLSANTLDVQSFNLYKRATHVYSEASRVWKFKAVCDEKATNGMDQLGQLMSASHTSCRDLYECSHPDLDNLVDICLKSGALGSRLTGAGWGGCAVSIVPADKVDTFLAKVKAEYYDPVPSRAAKLMAKSRGLEWRDLKKLGDLQQKLGLSVEDMLAVVKEVLHEAPYTKDEVCQILGVTPDELADTTLSANTLDVQSFNLYKRATHVYSEASRVWKFKAVCDEKATNGMDQLGQLMSASHTSCRDLYECSHPDLDNLVDICLKSGALGSRLTGAGWGGCAVSIVPADKVDTFLAKVKAEYYDPVPSRAAKVKESLFATQPGGGAAIYTC